MTLDEAIKRYTDNAEYERTHGNLQGCLDFRQLAEWLFELKQLRERTKWIPVSERLPEKTGLYLISIGDLVTSKSFDGHNFRTESAVRFIPDAWMPLPEPYKEESEGNE